MEGGDSPIAALTWQTWNQLTVVLWRPLSNIMVSALNQSKPCLLTEFEGTRVHA